MKNILTISFVFIIVFAHAQSDKTLVRQGNKSYQDKKFPDAEIDYRKALDKNPNSQSANFNLADAMYEQENFEKSAEIFAKIGQADLSKEQKAMAFYNLGNSFLKAKQYEQSIDAYKMALRNNPTDEDARYNLEYARKMMKQEQQKKDQNKDKDKQDQKKNQDKKDQEKKDQDDQGKKDENQEQQDKQDNPEDKGQAESQMNTQQSKQISKKDAERMLEALKNNEKNTLEKLKKGKKANGKVIKKEKDW